MNDFTKEELKTLYGLTTLFDGEAILPLRAKIKLMFDNYCEHELIPYPEDVTAVPYCNKCKKVII